MTDRLAEANVAMQFFQPEIVLSRAANGRLWLAYATPNYSARRAAVLTRDGSSLACRYGALGMGGTCAAATAQLIRWVRDETRLPLFTWEYWCGDSVRLADDHGSALLAFLQASSYVDAAKSTCIFCGSERIGDWYGPPFVQGPGCWGQACPDGTEHRPGNERVLREKP